MGGLCIGRLENRYRVPQGLGDLPGLANRLDALGAREVPRILERHLPSILSSAGLDPETEVVLRELRVRVRTTGSGIPDSRLAAGWARALAEAIEKLLHGVRDGRPGPNIAMFPDRIAAERAYLTDVAHGRSAAWWFRPLLGEGGRPPDPARIVERWIRQAPERAARELVAVARDVPGGLGSVIPDSVATRLAMTFLKQRRGRMAALLGRRRSPQEKHPSPDSGVPLTLDDRRRVMETPSGGCRRLLTLVLLFDRRPAVEIGSLDELDSIVATTQLAASDGTLDNPSCTMVEVQRRSSSVETAQDVEGSNDTPGTKAPLAEPTSTSTATHDVRCGGLLFLINPLARLGLLSAHAGAALEARLLYLGCQVLARVLAPLPGSIRAAAIERERPLLQVFTGLDSLPDDLASWTAEKPVRAEVKTIFSALMDAAPAGVKPFVPVVREMYGSNAKALSSDDMMAALSGIVLRPGRLLLTSTRAHLCLPVQSVDPALRRAGWDVDPGWVPYLGRVIRFLYEES